MKGNAGFFMMLVGASLLTVLFSGLAQPALAQTEQPEKDQTCWDCHSNLYALHDTGKWICLCGTQARCTFCHGGVVGEMDMEAAHQGLIANPLRDNAAVCQSCHPLDYEAHIQRFAALGGVSLTPLPEPIYNPIGGANSKRLTAPLEQEDIPVWRWVGLWLASLGLVVAILFGLNCCLQERRAKEKCD